MYASIKQVTSYAPQMSDLVKTRKSIIEKSRRMLTAILGREFMELPIRHKIYAGYFCLSLMTLCIWSETHVWPNLLNLLNFANAVRLANKATKKTSAKD